MGLEVNRGQSSLSIPNPNSQFPTPKSQPPIHRVVSPPTNNTASGAGSELPTLHLSRSLPGESPPPHPPLPSPPFRRGRLALRLFAATALPPPRLIHSESGLLAWTDPRPPESCCCLNESDWCPGMSNFQVWINDDWGTVAWNFSVKKKMM